MNETLVKQVLSTIVGIVGTLLAAKGLITTDQASQLSSTLLDIVGPLMTVGSIIYAAISHTSTNQIASTAKLTQVRRIVTNDSGTALKVARPNVVHSELNS